MGPKFSIVVPTYNRLGDLERMLRSVYSQTESDWELLIVDNRSSDGTAEMIGNLGDPRVRLFTIDNHGIISKSRNLGIAEARGDYIAFLDSDDWWATEKLRRAADAFGAGADVVYHDLFVVKSIDQRRFKASGSVRQVKPPVALDLLGDGNALANSGVVVRADALRAIGPLNEDPELVGIEDFDAWLRLAALTERFVMLKETLGYYWLGGGNTTNPTRTLRSLAAFERLRGPEMERLPKGGRPVWFLYARARALFRLSEFAQAREALAGLNMFMLPMGLFAKVLFMRLRMLTSR